MTALAIVATATAVAAWSLATLASRSLHYLADHARVKRPDKTGQLEGSGAGAPHA